MNDQQIIELYWKRDERAIEATSDKYGDYCFTIAQNILRDHRDSEECVSDTWIRTWNSIPPQRPGFLKAFLAKITRHISFDRYKTLRTQKRGSGELELALEELGDCLDHSERVEEQIQLTELTESIERFLSALPQRERNIFLRRYFFVESGAVIAARYGITENNVHLILSRTRKKLKSHLIQEGYEI